MTTPEPLMQFVILAQGDQTRLADLPHPKHHLLIDLDRTETIVGRTLRLIHEFHPTSPIVVVADRTPAWQQIVDTVGALLAPLPPATTVLHRLGQVLRAVPQNHHLVVVLGDVVFSRAAIARLAFRRFGLLTFFGTRGRVPPEVYALSIGPFHRTEFQESVDDVIAMGGKNLWELCRELPSTWTEVDDYTTDVDTEDDVANLSTLRLLTAADDAVREP